MIYHSLYLLFYHFPVWKAAQPSKAWILCVVQRRLPERFPPCWELWPVFPKKWRTEMSIRIYCQIMPFNAKVTCFERINLILVQFSIIHWFDLQWPYPDVDPLSRHWLCWVPSRLCVDGFLRLICLPEDPLDASHLQLFALPISPLDLEVSEPFREGFPLA